MKKITVFALFFAIFCTFSTIFAEDDEKLILAVMEFDDLSGKLPKEMLSGATEYTRSAFVASNKFVVIAKERQETAMIKKMKAESYKLCNDKNCQIPLGKALSADTILRTSINFFGGTYTITSELIDLAKEATIIAAKEDYDGSDGALKTALTNSSKKSSRLKPISLFRKRNLRKLHQAKTLSPVNMQEVNQTISRGKPILKNILTANVPPKPKKNLTNRHVKLRKKRTLLKDGKNISKNILTGNAN